MAKAKLYTDTNYQGRTVDVTSDITDFTTIDFSIAHPTYREAIPMKTAKFTV